MALQSQSKQKQSKQSKSLLCSIFNFLHTHLFFRSPFNKDRAISIFLIQDSLSPYASSSPSSTNTNTNTNTSSSAIPGKDSPVTIKDPVSIVSSLEEASTVVDRLIYLNSIRHYSSWCAINNHTPGFPSTSWDTYRTEVLIEQDDPIIHRYHIYRVDYSTADVASLFRIFASIPPLFLPFETQAERDSYFFSHYDQSLNQLLIPPLLYDATLYDQVISSTLTDIASRTPHASTPNSHTNSHIDSK